MIQELFLSPHPTAYAATFHTEVEGFDMVWYRLTKFIHKQSEMLQS